MVTNMRIFRMSMLFSRMIYSKMNKDPGCNCNNKSNTNSCRCPIEVRTIGKLKIRMIESNTTRNISRSNLANVEM